MNFLITGATGFVGGWLAHELARAYPNAALFGTAHGPTPLASLPAPMEILPCDLTDQTALARVVEYATPTHVFHLAGFASGAGGDREKIFRVNVEATVGLLSLLKRADRPCRVHLASSGYVYGATQTGVPARESVVPAPSGTYAESKRAMEEAAQAFASDTLSLTVTRSFNHTGPRQGTEFVVPAFARQIARIERGLDPPVVQVGNLDARRDFLHVADVVRAYRLLVCETEPAPWRVVNVASGSVVTIQAMLDQLIAFSTATPTVETDPARLRPSDLPECMGDSALLKSLTGWEPEIALNQTLKETLDFWRGVSFPDAAAASA